MCEDDARGLVDQARPQLAGGDEVSIRSKLFPSCPFCGKRYVFHGLQKDWFNICEGCGQEFYYDVDPTDGLTHVTSQDGPCYSCTGPADRQARQGAARG